MNLTESALWSMSHAISGPDDKFYRLIRPNRLIQTGIIFEDNNLGESVRTRKYMELP